jgi:predicted phosphodiesterase
VALHGEFAELEMGGRVIAVTHYPAIAAGLAASDRYDLVCCGHTHRVAEERVGDTLLINSGEVMGRFGRSTYVLYDTVTGETILREI